MSDLTATTSVTVELSGRRPTLADVQWALDTLRAEGIPETFDVAIRQSEDRKYVEGVPYAERSVTFEFSMTAERCATSPAASSEGSAS